MIHESYSIIDTTWFHLFVLLVIYFSRKNVSDVMQDKGHNTANSPTFKFMSAGNHAYKSHRNIKTVSFSTVNLQDI